MLGSWARCPSRPPGLHRCLGHLGVSTPRVPMNLWIYVIHTGPAHHSPRLASSVTRLLRHGPPTSMASTDSHLICGWPHAIFVYRLQDNLWTDNTHIYRLPDNLWMASHDLRLQNARQSVDGGHSHTLTPTQPRTTNHIHRLPPAHECRPVLASPSWSKHQTSTDTHNPTPSSLPSWPRDGPRWPQDGPNMATDRPNMAQDRPKIAQHGPEMAHDGGLNLMASVCGGGYVGSARYSYVVTSGLDYGAGDG